MKTKEELNFLDFLQKNLSEEYEIFFRPFINGDRPDIVILKKYYGVIIIDIKNLNLNDYYIDNKTNWHLKSDDREVLSPLEQVEEYKEDFFNLHIDSLWACKFKRKAYKSIINTMVYFINEDTSSINDFLLKNFKGLKYLKYRRNIKHIKCYGDDILDKKNFNNFIERNFFSSKSNLFGNDIYLKIKDYMIPSMHALNEGINYEYTPEQQELIRSEARPRRKIKGLVGSGKTFVLAKRAVNAHLRTKSRVLILSCNLSLVNYIHDWISKVRDEFSWDGFYITDYYQFFKAAATNMNLKINSLDDFNNVEFFDPVKDEIEKYESVFIDEIQDYGSNWLEIINKYFLKEEGEFVVFGEENIDVRTVGIPGAWNKSLTEYKRSNDKITRLALSFQQELMGKKFSEYEKAIISEPTFNYEQEILKYIKLKSNISNEDLFTVCKKLVRAYNIPAHDITILSDRRDRLIELDYLLRNNQNLSTITTFENKECIKKIKKQFYIRGYKFNNKRFDIEIKKARRNKEFNFSVKNNMIKLSTIDSFKGWEAHTIFLIIEKDKTNSNELVYNGITRAKNNLFIINLGNDYYDKFFKRTIF